MIILKAEREIYLVSPEMAAELAGECIPVTVFTVVSSVGVVSLWPVRLPGPDGKDLAWWVTEREAAALGMKHWVRIKANMALGANDTDISEDDREAKTAGRDVPGAENRFCRPPHRQRRPLRRQATAWARLGCGKVLSRGDMGGGFRVHRTSGRATGADLHGCSRTPEWSYGSPLAGSIRRRTAVPDRR